MYVGLDVIFDSTAGRWCVLEANDRPGGFSLGQSGATAASSVASSIFRRREIVRAAFAVPAYLEDPSILDDIDRADSFGQQNDLAFLSMLASDYRALKHSLGGALEPVRAVDLLVDGEELRHPSGKTFTFLFCMASQLPIAVPDSLVLNNERMRAACRDKLSTFRLLSEEFAVRSFEFVCDELIESATSGFVVCKPRYGSGSVEVVRVPSTEVRNWSPPRSPRGIQDFIYQPWIDSLAPGHKARFDMRVILCDGEVISLQKRTAASSHDGAAAGTVLDWLTTTGSLVAIALPAPFLGDSIPEPNELVTLCTKAYARLAETTRC